MMKRFSRRDVTRFALMAPALALAAKTGLANAQEDNPDLVALFGTPGTPIFGPEDANLTMVAFLDYNCPFCKKSAPHLKTLMETDDKLRVIFKDWPILTKASVYGAQAALAAHKHGQYLAAHEALMSIPGVRIPEEQMRKALEASEVDMKKVDATIAEEGDQILNQLRVNVALADQIGLTGTPSYLVGPYFAGSALDIDGFRDIVSQARKKLGV